MLIWSSGNRRSIKAKAASIELILVEVEVVEDVVENPKSGHQVGAGTSWVIPVGPTRVPGFVRQLAKAATLRLLTRPVFIPRTLLRTGECFEYGHFIIPWQGVLSAWIPPRRPLTNYHSSITTLEYSLATTFPQPIRHLQTIYIQSRLLSHATKYGDLLYFTPSHCQWGASGCTASL